MLTRAPELSWESGVIFIYLLHLKKKKTSLAVFELQK